ncbi:MAG: 2-dehydropantoate 2-reductase [Coriobacteriia bacterium]|nr:2-dehydropantoate 2-reductase [Coriobacteriia bacterium]
MKYAIVGSGAVGSIIADYLVQAGKEVTAIARGKHLQALQSNDGLRVMDPNGQTRQSPVPATAAQDYEDVPDVVFVCVKDHSLESVYPFLERVATPETTVIPLSNVYGTGDRIRAHLLTAKDAEAPLVTCGCVYCAGNIEAPGFLVKDRELCQVVYGMPEQQDHLRALPRLSAICTDASHGNLDCKVSSDIRRDHLRKFAHVASVTATDIIFGCTMGAIQGIPEVRLTFFNAVQEVQAVAQAMGINLGDDLIDGNSKLVATAPASATTSCQRDLEAGRPSEVNGLIRQVVTWGVSYGVPTPVFARASVVARDRFGV